MNKKADYDILREAQSLILKFGYKKVTMTDVANSCCISRTTLYKSYKNKEALISGLIDEALEKNIKKSDSLINGDFCLNSKLESFFDIWVVEPASIVIDLESGRDILLNIETYAPDAVAKHYSVFEKTLVKIIKNEAETNARISADDLGKIITISSKGIKSSASNLKDLKRMVNGLVTIIVDLTSS